MSDEKILLTAAEVANLTGFAEGTIRHFVSQRRIPFIRISPRCVRFRRSDIEAWLEKLMVPTIPAPTPINLATKNYSKRAA